jgi:putative transposon-encoded protein
MSEELEIKATGYEVLKKEAKLTSRKSTSCTIYVPKEWEGKKVVIIRVEK